MKLAFLLAITHLLPPSSARSLEPIRLAAASGTVRPRARHSRARLGEPLVRSSRPPAIRKWSAEWCEKWTPIRSSWKPKTLAS